MHLEIVTPDGTKVDESVAEVTARSVLGEMGILPGHIPLLTVLDIGRLSYRSENSDEAKYVAVGGGFFEVDGDRIIVMTESAEFKEDIDVERARKAKEEAEHFLGNDEDAGSALRERKMRKLKRADNRLEIASENA